MFEQFNVYKSLATLVLVIIAVGLLVRRRRTLHVPLMLSAFVIDMSMLVAIEVSRKAVENAVDAVADHRMPGILLFHIVVSSVLVVCYFFMLWSGYRLLRRGVGRRRHFVGACAFLICRAINYITSFMIPTTGG